MSRLGSVLTPQARPPDGAPGRGPHRLLRRLAVAATASTFLLVSIGALVRATGSGDACPDWPRCFGRWIPRFEYHVLIEYSHRLAALAVIVMVAALATHAWRRYRRVPRVVRPAVAALALVVVQALLGAVVVWTELEALNVTAHLATAMLLVASLVYATVAAFTVETKPLPAGLLTRPARAVAASTFVLMMVGALVRSEGAGLAFPDWPLMDGRLILDLSSGLRALHFTHRVLAGVVGVLVLWLAVRARRSREGSRPTATLALLAVGLFAVQIAVGAANVWSELSAAAVVAHVLVAALLWGALVGVEATSRLGVTDAGLSGIDVAAREASEGDGAVRRAVVT